MESSVSRLSTIAALIAFGIVVVSTWVILVVKLVFTVEISVDNVVFTLEISFKSSWCVSSAEVSEFFTAWYTPPEVIKFLLPSVG